MQWGELPIARPRRGVASWATAEPAGLNRKEDAMTTDTIEERRREL